MSRYLKVFLLTGISLARLQPAFSQNLSLDSVYALIDKNPSLLAYVAAIKAKDMYATGARSLDAPRLSAGQYQTPYQLRPSMGSFMISAEQQFTNPVKLRAKESYLKGLSKVTAGERSALRNELFSQATQAYDDRIILEKKAAVLQESGALLSYILKDAKIKLTYGKEHLSAIYSLSADTYTLENTREQLRNEIEQKTILLNTLMSRPASTAFLVDTVLRPHTYEKESTDSVTLILARSDIRQVSSNLALRKLSINMELSKRLPDFGIQVAHMLSYGGARNQYILMGSLTLPFLPWSSREYKANLKGLQYEASELEDQQHDLYNQARGRIAGIRINLASKKKQQLAYGQHIIPELTNSYKTALRAYTQNTGDLSSVLIALRLLQTSRLEALTLLQDIIQLEVSYARENERY